MQRRHLAFLLPLAAGLPHAVRAAQSSPRDTAAPGPDPLRSPLWSAMRQRFLDDGQPVLFDSRVVVRLPASAEDPLAVPVEVDCAGLDGVDELLLFADLNPLPKILSYTPLRAAPSIAFRFKVEQSTPVRAAARMRDGVWRVGGAWVAASGGGCTMPSAGSGDAAWKARLGEVSARQWARAGGMSRLRLRIVHPMDTGLAAGIPVFHLDTLRVCDEAGQALARLQLFEPVSENPVLSLDLRSRGALRIDGRDTQANRVRAWVPA